MEKLKFDNGMKSYRVGGGVLTFNPCDPAVYERFLEMADSLQTMTPSDVKQADAALREALGKVFPGSDLAAMFPGSLLAMCGNGKLLIENFLEALEPVILDGARRYARQ